MDYLKDKLDHIKMMQVHGFEEPDFSHPRGGGPRSLNYMGNKELFFICDYCGQTFSMLKELYMIRRSDALISGWTKVCCFNKECIRKRKQEVVEKSHITSKSNGSMEAAGLRRRGKKIEELYGVETATRVREVLSEKHGDVKPHLGMKHSVESRKLMSDTWKKFLGGRAKEFLWVSPISGLMVDFMAYRRDRGILRKLVEPEELKVARREKWVKSYMTNVDWSKRYSYRGKLLNCYTGKDVVYESTYELVYFTMLNNQKALWDKNCKIYIPYFNSIEKINTFYVPDILYYDDLGKMIGLGEVKPEYFVSEGTCDYSRKTRDKLEALKVFAALNNLFYKVITEKDLDQDVIKVLGEQHEDKRKALAALIDHKKGLLPSC